MQQNILNRTTCIMQFYENYILCFKLIFKHLFLLAKCKKQKH